MHQGECGGSIPVPRVARRRVYGEYTLATVAETLDLLSGAKLMRPNRCGWLVTSFHSQKTICSADPNFVKLSLIRASVGFRPLGKTHRIDRSCVRRFQQANCISIRFNTMWSLLRPLSALNATAYLLASVLSVALHTHAPHTHVSGEASADACASCSCGHDHQQSSGASDKDESSETPDGEHECVVCDFIAKAPLPVEPVQVVELWTPALSMPGRELVSVQVVFLSHFWGRAPPVA